MEKFLLSEFVLPMHYTTDVNQLWNWKLSKTQTGPSPAALKEATRTILAFCSNISEWNYNGFGGNTWFPGSLWPEMVPYYDCIFKLTGSIP